MIIQQSTHKLLKIPLIRSWTWPSAAKFTVYYLHCKAFFVKHYLHCKTFLLHILFIKMKSKCVYVSLYLLVDVGGGVGGAVSDGLDTDPRVTLDVRGNDPVV